MAQIHGKAGKTLQKQLAVLFGIIAATGVATWLIILLVAPMFAPLAPLAGLFLAFKLLSDRDISRKLTAKARGFMGESRVSTQLENLPGGWRVFHDLNLGGENADHVVVGPKGVFNIEVKNHSGRVLATPKGLYNKGQKQDKIVRQAWRQAHNSARRWAWRYNRFWCSPPINSRETASASCR